MALSKLVMRQNNFHGAEAGKVFSNMLAQNTVLKELDLSSQKVGVIGYPLDAAFVKEFAVGISDNGVMLSLDISSNELTQGVVSGYDSDADEEYAMDMTGAVHYKNCSITLLTVWCVICRCCCPC